MTSEIALRNEGLEVLTKHLGKVNAERFIALIIREPFDYTEWQKRLFTDVSSVEELSTAAMKYVESRGISGGS